MPSLCKSVVRICQNLLWFWIYLHQELNFPKKYKDHQLTGNLHDFRECHIEPDWLLMYQIFENELILSATATGTHSDLFG